MPASKSVSVTPTTATLGELATIQRQMRQMMNRLEELAPEGAMLGSAEGSFERAWFDVYGPLEEAWSAAANLIDRVVGEELEAA